MLTHLRANVVLLIVTVLLCCVAYPLVLYAIGQTAFHNQAEGSLLWDGDGRVFGSRLIGQPFSADEYFQPRPSSVSYNAMASGASNWGASNYQLRYRVAQALGPIVKYGNKSPQKGQLAGPDIEAWFQKDRYQGQPGIVARWATLHPAVAQNWVKADPAHAAFVADWQKEHPTAVAAWVKENPDNPNPKPEDLAVLFFESYAKSFPGTFPSLVEFKAPSGKIEKHIERVKAGKDIQANFFDLWRQEHADADLEDVPADIVMASGSGLDPHITLKNALVQLERVANAWGVKTGRDHNVLHNEIEKLLLEESQAPLGGLAGVPLVNVLKMNLRLREQLETNAKRP